MDKYLKIRDVFEQKANQENAASMTKYMRNLFPFYGISTPERKAVYKDFIKEEKRKKEIDWEFLNQCYKDEHREFQYLVYDYLIAMSRLLAYDDIPQVEKYIREKQWWDTIDFSVLFLEADNILKSLNSYEVA